MKYISLFVVAVFTLSAGYCFEGRTYVQPNQIALSDTGIFVYLENAWILTEALHTDASGLYVINLVDEKLFGWKCPKCGRKQLPPKGGSFQLARAADSGRLTGGPT